MRKIVLVVEDEIVQRKLLTDGLTRLGYKVLEAANGQLGLSVAIRNHPDIILTDLRMPLMDGMEMIHKLRDDEWSKQVPIVILTNFENTDSQLDRIIADHPSYYLMKVDSTISKIAQKIEELTT